MLCKQAPAAAGCLHQATKAKLIARPTLAPGPCALLPAPQAPFVVLVSAAGGLLGAAFNALRVLLWRVRASRKRTALRLAEAAAVMLATVAVTAALALRVGRCAAAAAAPCLVWPYYFYVFG